MQANSQTEFLWLVSQGLFGHLSEGWVWLHLPIHYGYSCPANAIRLPTERTAVNLRLLHFLSFCVLDLKKKKNKYKNGSFWLGDMQYRQNNFFFFLKQTGYHVEFVKDLI